MNYCKICSRIVDKDLNICPYCNSPIDSKQNNFEDTDKYYVDDRTDSIDISNLNQIVEKNQKLLNKKSGKNRNVSRRNKRSVIVPTDQSFVMDTEIIPKNLVKEEISATIEEEKGFSIGLKTFFSFISILLPPLGIIISIILIASSKNEKKKLFSQDLLIFCIILTLIIVISFAVFTYLFSEVLDLFMKLIYLS